MSLILHIDVDALTVGDLETLEGLSKVREMRAWLVGHAGITDEEFKTLPAKELRGVLEQVRQSIAGALDLPKANGSSSG